MIVLQALGRMQGERILDEFEVSDDQQRTRIVRTLTDIDAHWTDHVAFKLKA